MRELLDLVFWGNRVYDYLIFLGSLVISFVIILIFKHILLKRLSVWARKMPVSMDDVFICATKRRLLLLMYVGALCLNIRWLNISERAARIMGIAALALLMVLAAAFISALLTFLLNLYLNKEGKTAGKSAIHWASVLIRTIVWICALLLFLENLGIEISALIAGLGIGGIAVAFAAQAVLEDIFSFVSIVLDRPFELDDFILVGEMMGTVEHIGIKTTRLRSLSGEQLIFSNKDLTNSRVSNYKRMNTRRVLFTINVIYSTPSHLLREIPDIIKKSIEEIEGVTFERAHFKAVGTYGLVFETVYHVLSRDYILYMDVQQTINLRIKELFEQRGIALALPTQTLHVE